jgi:lysophospholipid acyltransferase (LPLAT)-like uncharacterized protein
MNSIDTLITRIKSTSERDGMVRLAQESGVPYSTIAAFAARGWRHKGLDTVKVLAEASARLDAAAQGRAA